MNLIFFKIIFLYYGSPSTKFNSISCRHFFLYVFFTSYLSNDSMYSLQAINQMILTFISQIKDSILLLTFFLHSFENDSIFTPISHSNPFQTVVVINYNFLFNANKNMNKHVLMQIKYRIIKTPRKLPFNSLSNNTPTCLH